ncbi:transcriptional regulator [Liquorilactobacillus sp.]|uniref:transcriptional regulator n=1 Tax=Liquorilactobacillus sp. TaxID=2767923 RepID=UPI0039EC9B9B
MKKSTIRKIEDILRDYPKIDKYIEAREMELRYPHQIEDSNVGGGRAKNKRAEPIEHLVITIDEDRMLHSLRKQRDVVDDCLDESDIDTKSIVNELYFKKRPQYTMSGLVQNNIVHVGLRRAYDLRNIFIGKVAVGLGLYDF